MRSGNGGHGGEREGETHAGAKLWPTFFLHGVRTAAPSPRRRLLIEAGGEVMVTFTLPATHEGGWHSHY